MSITSELTIRKDNLPDSLELVYEYLFEVLPDNNIELKYEDQNVYTFLLSPNNYDYCENLSSGLNWLKLSNNEIYNFYHKSDKHIFSLNDSWMSFGWLEYIKNNRNKKITVLHIDDHQDLLSPRIYIKNNHWFNAINKKKISRENLHNIKEAIQTGAIGIGSILCVLFNSNPNIEILHLKQNSIDKYRQIKVKPTRKKFLDSEYNFIDVDFIDSNSTNYIVSSNISTLLKEIDKESNILLHIDMDYFNNRYNGDSDWKKVSVPDHDESYQKKLIDKIISSLEEVSLSGNIKHTGIAISPSFYPCKYWESMLTYLINNLVNIGVDLKNLQSYISNL